MKKPEENSGYLFSKGYSNYVFILLFLLYMFDYIDRIMVTSMFTSIERDWGITHTQSGMLVSAVYWAIVLLTFPVSILVDRWSRTKTIGIMAIMWSLATALCALTGNFVQLFMARLLIGVGEAGYAPGGSAMISGLYPIDKRAKDDGNMECINSPWFCNRCTSGRNNCVKAGMEACIRNCCSSRTYCCNSFSFC